LWKELPFLNLPDIPEKETNLAHFADRRFGRYLRRVLSEALAARGHELARD
jgi:hypothetical protein